MALLLDGQPVCGEARLTAPCTHILTVHTVLSQLPYALEAHSTFVGHQTTTVHATHLLLGPLGCEPTIASQQLSSRWYHPSTHPQACVYEHIAQLIDRLADTGHHARLRELRLHAALRAV